MKKTISILLTLSVCTCLFSQEAKQKPYFSLATGVSSTLLTYGLEAGIYDFTGNRFWIATMAEITPKSNNALYLGIRTYYAVFKPDSRTQVFFNLAAKAESKKFNLIIEPGIAFVYSINSHWFAQWNISTYFYEEHNIGGPAHFSAGPCINYCF